MKNVIYLLVFILLSNAIHAQEPIEVQGGHQIEILTSAVCDMCKETLEYDLTFQRGVKSVNLDVPSKVLTVVYNERRTTPDAIRKRVTEIGYHADDLTRDPEAYENLPLCCQDNGHMDDNGHHRELHGDDDDH